MNKILLLTTLFFAAAFFAPPGRAAVSGSTMVTKSALTATASVAKAAPCILTYWNISNTNSTTVYVQFFDAASTSGITLGTTAPLFWIAIPGGSPGGVTDGLAGTGIAFQNGIVVAATTTPTGSTAPSSTVPVVLAVN
jgi:hypothetical protein